MALFKKMVFLFFMMFAFFYASLAHSAESIELIELWPDNKSGLMSIVGDRIFFGDVREIRILDFDLNIRNSISIQGVGDINGLHYSASTPGFLYAALGTGGMNIIDITDPDNTQKTGRLIGSIPTEGQCFGVYVNGGTAYAATGNSGLKIIDVSTPSNPVAKGSPFLPGALAQTSVRSVVMSGERVYVADALNGLWSIDSTAADYTQDFGMLIFPGARSILPFPDTDQNTDQNLWLAGGAKLVSVDTRSANMSSGEWIELTRPVDMVFSGGRILVADSQSGVRHIGTSDNENNSGLQILGTTKEDGMVAHSIAVSGNRFFAGDHRFGIRSADMANLSGSSGISGGQVPERFNGPSRRLSSRLSGLTIIENGNKVFAAVSDPLNPSDNGLLAFDTSTVTLPTVVARVRLQGEPSCVKAADKTAFVASGTAGLRIVDISNFEAFKEISGMVFSDRVNDLDISEKKVYLAAGTAGLRIIDVSDLAHPVEKGSFSPSGISCKGVAVSVGTAYLADNSAGIMVVDVSEPENPKMLSAIGLPGRIKGLTLSGKYLYVGNSLSGLEVYDITEPKSPQLKGSLVVDAGDSDWRMSAADEAVFIASGEKGMIAVDISKPEAPVLFEGWKYNYESVSGVWAKSGDPMFVYLAADTSGLRILGLKRDEGEEKPPFVPKPFGQGGKHSECFIGSVLF